MRRFWDKDRPPQQGQSFLPDDRPRKANRPKTAPSSPAPSVLSASAASSSSSPFAIFRKQSVDSSAASILSTSPTPPDNATGPVISLRLSSISFLDSVVHDGVSDNPLYVIETEQNLTKIRRSDPKGFINVARVLWREEPNYFARSKKELHGIQLAFGKGQWKPADEFLGYSYSSLSSSYLKFYLPHHPHSLRWKRVGSAYHCTTQSVKGPVAVLEPSYGLTPPQLRILDPIFPEDSSRLQRMHAGVPISLLDFLLVTAMLLLTEHDEWRNITRAPAASTTTTTTPADDPEPSGSGSADVDPDPDPDAQDLLFPSSYSVTQSSRPPPPIPPIPPTPTRSRTLPYGTSRNPSSTSLASGVSGSARGIERWRANVATTPDDLESRSSADADSVSESPSNPTSPLNPRFSIRSSSSSSRAAFAFTSSSSPRDLPIPPVPANPYAQAQVPQIQQQQRNAATPSPRSPSPAPSSLSQSVFAPPAPPWDTTPTPSASTPRIPRPPSSTSSSAPPLTPARALPPVPLPLKAVPSSPPSSLPRTPSTHVLLPSRSSPALRRERSSTSPPQMADQLAKTYARPPPPLPSLSPPPATGRHPPPVPPLPAHARRRSEFSGAQAERGIVDAVGALAIDDPGSGARVGGGVGADEARPDSLYDAPPAYSQHDFERSPFRGQMQMHGVVQVFAIDA